MAFGGSNEKTKKSIIFIKNNSILDLKRNFNWNMIGQAKPYGLFLIIKLHIWSILFRIIEIHVWTNVKNILLFSTPSYNASVSPVLKNAFDWLSRPSPIYENKVPVFGKKAALMSTTYISQEQLKDCVKMGAYRKL